MRDSGTSQDLLRVASIIPSLNAGGVGSVCRYAAAGIARSREWQVSLVCLHDPVGENIDPECGLRMVGLGFKEDCPRGFLQWLAANPQELIITSDVSRIESAFRFLPPATRHVVQIHDSVRRYREVAVRHAGWIDGVTCVGRHIEAPLRQRLDTVGFRGLLRTVHNGANFPPARERPPYSGPLRLLFMGGVTATKGVFDLVPLLHELRKLDVPVSLKIVGGGNDALRCRFERIGLADMIQWTGRVPHEKCYEIAAESDIFMMTSRKEPFGMVTVEAMGMGCVPIAYDTPSGSTEIIEHGKNGILVPLGDFREWAVQIQALDADRALLACLSAGAMERARSQFNAEVMSTNLTGFLRDVMEHAILQPALREAGVPPEEPPIHAAPARGYQRLPAGLREWIRNSICARPRLSYWLLNR